MTGKRRTLIFLPALLALFFAVAIFGAARWTKTLTFALTANGKEVFRRSYECSPAASLRLFFCYDGSTAKLYEKEYLGNYKAFFGYLNSDIYGEVTTAMHGLDRPPVEPSVAYFGKGVFEYTDGASGIECDEGKTLSRLAKNSTAEIAFREVKPTYETEDLRRVTREAGRAVTSYGTSSAERKKNIALAAEKIDGARIMPGERFSFNQTVGKRTRENGFCEAKVIVKGEYVEGVGGGVCQVSTTLYNAWLKAGREAVSSGAHSLKPSYVPPGLDAMVSESRDLVLENRGAYPAYIAAEANGTTLSVRIFGEPLPCKIRLVSERVSLDEDGKEVYRSYREFTENGEVYVKEFLRTSTYFPPMQSAYKPDSGDTIINEDDKEEIMKSKIVRTGEKPGKGKYSCTNCHTRVTLDASDKMPPCPKCTNSEFTKTNG